MSLSADLWAEAIKEGRRMGLRRRRAEEPAHPKGACGPAAFASPRHLLETQNLRFHLRPAVRSCWFFCLFFEQVYAQFEETDVEGSVFWETVFKIHIKFSSRTPEANGDLNLPALFPPELGEICLLGREQK